MAHILAVIHILLKLSAKRLYCVFYFRKIICALFQKKYSILGKIYFWSKEIFGPVTLKLKREWNRIWIKLFMFLSLPHRSYALFHRYCLFCSYTMNQFWYYTYFCYLTSLINSFLFCTKKKIYRDKFFSFINVQTA